MGRGGAPVRMNFTGPVRIPQDRQVAREEEKYEVTAQEKEQDKENLPHPSDQGGAKPKQFTSHQSTTTSTSRIRERLQVLSGSHTNTAPLAPIKAHATPTLPLQTQVTPTIIPTLTKATTLPPQHMHTPLPSTNPAPPQRPELTMPPPSMSMSHQAKEQVLVVRGKRYKVMKLLGKGGSSRVYEALDEKNIVVAIKRVDLSDADEAQTAGNFLHLRKV